MTDGVIYIKGNKEISSRDNYIKCENLEVGQYMLACELEWKESTKTKDFVVTTYGAGKISMYEEIENPIDNIKLLNLTCDAMVEQNYGEITEDVDDENENIKKYTFITEFGYRMYKVQNNSDDTYCEEMEYPKFEGMELLPPESGNGYNIKLESKTQKNVIIRLNC